MRLDPDVVSQLDELAGEMQRSRSFLIAQAVGEFVERDASLIAVREGEADIEAGRSIEGDDVRAWFEDLKKGRTREAPAARKRRGK